MNDYVDYFPLRIRVFRNGDMFDQGRILVVTRKQFKHWIVFLDSLTTLLHTATAVRKLFTVQGVPIHHFDELETNGEYVAVETGPYISVPYGRAKFTLRGKRYNPIIRAPPLIPTFLHSAESMDIYLKKEGYGTITGLPYPFDGILSRSPSASNIQIKHLSSHVPPLKIGGSMEHLNELGTASWLGKNEKWMMGERVNVETKVEKEKEKKKEKEREEDVVNQETKEGSTSSEKGNEKSRNTTKLPRLLNSNRSFKRERPTPSITSEEVKSISENLPPIDLKGISSNEIVKKETKKENDMMSIKTEEEVISIVKPEKATTGSIVSSKVSRKVTAPVDDEVRYHRSYQVTETTYVTTGSNEQEKQEQPVKVEGEAKKTERKERAKWSDGIGTGAGKKEKRPAEKSIGESTESVEKNKHGKEVKNVELKKEEKSEKKKADNTGTERVVRKKKASGELAQFDMDINEIPIRFEEAAAPIGNKIVTSRSSMHLFVDEMVGEELDDVIGRAQLWDMNRRRQKMRQQCTQTSGSLRSISAPRRRVQLFDPDFD